MHQLCLPMGLGESDMSKLDDIIGRRRKIAKDICRHSHVNEGEALLAYCADETMDLIVMGGYGHTRFREMVLGGATREILLSMTIPVLMTH
jgi:nucleotide-binding universal stress UspA family protein